MLVGIRSNLEIIRSVYHSPQACIYFGSSVISSGYCCAPCGTQKMTGRLHLTIQKIVGFARSRFQDLANDNNLSWSDTRHASLALRQASRARLSSKGQLPISPAPARQQLPRSYRVSGSSPPIDRSLLRSPWFHFQSR